MRALQRIVQVLQKPLRIDVVPELYELDTDLRNRSVQVIKFLREFYNDLIKAVGRFVGYPWAVSVSNTSIESIRKAIKRFQS